MQRHLLICCPKPSTPVTTTVLDYYLVPILLCQFDCDTVTVVKNDMAHVQTHRNTNVIVTEKGW